MRKYYYYCPLLVLALLFCSRGGAQSGLNLSKTYPSPDAASLGNFGLVPATPFSGQADISIPLYPLRYKDIEVPLTMRYNTGGIKPDEHPGFTGIGWTLQAGGAIIRKANGMYDEHPVEMPISNDGVDYSYYTNCGRIAANFANLDSILNYTTTNFPYDGLPDEFIFNFNGYSGTFFITRASPTAPVELKVKPNGPYKLKAEILSIQPNLTFNDWYRSIWHSRITSKTIYAFRITDENGLQYTFGNHVDAIEFSNNGNLTRDFFTIASAWYLTSITSPGGNTVQFKYKRMGRTFVQHKQRNGLFYNTTTDYSNIRAILFYYNVTTGHSFSGFLSQTIISLQNPVHLDSIITPVQHIAFSASTTNDLDYPFDNQVMSQIADGGDGDTSTWQKLDLIDIAGVQKFKFHYRNRPDKRLRLDSIEILTTANERVGSYRCRYNSRDLPAYNARMADHWGYYNGRTYEYGVDYLTTREPVPEFMTAETLDSLIYPTRGFVKLTYEPHNFRKVAKQYPFETATNTVDSIAGGLRVKRITSGASATDTMSREFFYTSNYIGNGTASSGVLSGTPQYTTTGGFYSSFHQDNFWMAAWGNSSLYYGKILDNNFLPLSNTNGNHVTYTEVTEKFHEGYQRYTYSNHDNGYKDRLPYVMVSNHTSQWHEEKFISMETFRGLLLRMDYYDKDKNPVKHTTYEYVCDTTSNYYRIPYFYRHGETIGNAWIVRASTGVHFMKPVLVKKETDTTRVPATSSYMVQTKTNRYFNELYPAAQAAVDNYKEAEIKTVNSANEEITVLNAYPVTMVQQGRDPSGIYQGMVNYNMPSVLVETKTMKGVTPLSLTRTNYYAPFTNVFLPQTIVEQVGEDTAETRFRFLQYDNTANILSQQKNNDLVQGFIWDYKKTYPIAEITNATAAACAYTSFEADGNGNFNVPAGNRVPEAITGNQAFALGVSGNITFPSPGGNIDYVLSYWSRSGQVTVSGVTSIGVKTGITLNGWVYYEHAVRTTTANITVSSATVKFIDELRLYPAAATMATYTYNPALGRTSQCSASNILTYYHYDQLGRLRFVRDAEGNITRSFEYRYKQ